MDMVGSKKNPLYVNECTNMALSSKITIFLPLIERSELLPRL